MNWFNELFDLAAVASGAGLGGGVISALVVSAFSGAFLKFIIRIVVTAVITGVGFYFLLGWLGFEIVPRDEIAASPAPSASVYARSEGFLSEVGNDELAGASPAPAEREDTRQIVVTSPFRRGD
ncbi:hypothetical protein [Henriciella marina]|uniref:hypothetical protein n=1 Tax=Henriciella marina TaxID=453851 RepID=UPI00036DDCBD|nr:hypothetical protein [Henriciella marina]